MTYEEVVEVAKTTIYRFGGVDPLVIAVGPEKQVFVALELEDGEDVTECQEAFLQLGQQLRTSGELTSLERVYYIGELFVEAEPEGEPPDWLAALGSRRAELLIVLETAIGQPDRIEAFQLIRNGAGQVIDLLRVPAEDLREDLELPVLTAVLIGFAQASGS